jgi:glycosyltransferase involved in cell wall biosynthesis
LLAGGHHKKINSECIEHMILQGFSPCKDVLEIEDDPQKFADKVCDLLNDKTFRKKNLAAASRNFVLQKHNWNKNLCAFVSLCENK